MGIKSKLALRFYQTDNFSGVVFTMLYRQRGFWRGSGSLMFSALIMYLSLLKRRRLDKCLITYTGICVFILKRTVIKLPLSPVAKQDLEKSHMNYRLLKKTPVYVYLDYQQHYFHGGILMSRLCRLESIDNKILLEIQRRIAQLNTGHKKISIGDLTAPLQKYYPALGKNIFQNVEMLWPVSGMHGDLTPLNIMGNKRGGYVLIDLDRFTLEGSYMFDSIHYGVEEQAKAQGVRFFDIVEQRLRKSSSLSETQEYLFYFLYRIHLEMRPLCTPSKKTQMAVHRLISVFEEKLSI